MSKDDQPWLTRYISKYTPSAAQWDAINDEKLRVAAVGAEDNKIIAEAKRPHIHRFRSTTSAFLQVDLFLFSYSRIRFFDGGIQNNVPLGVPRGMQQTDIRQDYEFRNRRAESSEQ